MSHVTTHVLDAATGLPAAGVEVTLTAPDGTVLAQARTDSDGRVRGLGPDALTPGDHRLTFATGAWFAAQGRATFYPRVVVDFTVEPAPGSADGGDEVRHLHVPLLLSPYAYSTYRGS